MRIMTTTFTAFQQFSSIEPKIFQITTYASHIANSTAITISNEHKNKENEREKNIWYIAIYRIKKTSFPFSLGRLGSIVMKL